MYSLMIVDDSNLIRKKLAREIDKKMFNVVGEASDGGNAIELFQQLKPQVVTMDLTMPNLDGLECIEQLIALDPEVRILVVSALNDKATGIEALELGAMGFVNKPFTEDEIVEALEVLVED